MQAILQPRNSWDEINLKVLQLLKLDSLKCHVKLYRGIEHALTEVTIGLSQQFPHKKKAYYLSGVSPFIKRPMTQLSVSGFNVTEKKHGSLESLEELTNELTREDLFFLMAEDDVLTGEKHNITELEALVLEKKLFSVKIKNINNSEIVLPERMQVMIFPISANLCLVVSGVRGRIPDMVSGGMSWGDDDLVGVQKYLSELSREESNLVSQFEANLPFQAQALINGKQRVYDRTVFCFEDMDGHAYIHYLAEALGDALKPAGEETRFECASRSRWKDENYFNWLLEKGFTKQQLRGLVILSSKYCKDEYRDLLISTRDKVLKMQVGNA